VGGAEVPLRAVRDLVERFRAAGTIPTLRATLEMEASLSLGAEGYATRGEAVLLDGSHALDGTWPLDYIPGPEEVL